MSDENAAPKKTEPLPDRAKAELQGALVAAGIIHTDVVPLFVAWADDRLTFDAEKNALSNLAELIAQYRAEKPDLFRSDEAPAKASRREKRLVVDEEREVAIPVGISSYTFRPGQVLIDPYVIGLAKEHKIALREK